MPTRPECPENAPSSPVALAMAARRRETERPVIPKTLAARVRRHGTDRPEGRRGALPRYWTAPSPS